MLRFWFLAATTFIPELAWPQWIPIGGDASIGGVPVATTSSMALFVDPTGNDANACTMAGAAACKTLPGACAKVPKWIRHDVTVTAAAGTYATGCFIEGHSFMCGAGNTAKGCHLKIVGTLANSVLASGLVTGTLSAATGGSSTLGTLASKATATVAAAGWTASDLRNRILVITGGTGVGQSRVIVENTATVATLGHIWDTTPNGTSTFAIQDSASVISGGLTLPASQARVDKTAAAVSTTAIANYASFIVANNGGSSSSQTTAPETGNANTSDAAVMIERFAFSGATHALAVRHSGATLLYQNQITGAITATVGSAVAVYDGEVRIVGNAVTNLAANAPAVATLTFGAARTNLIVRGNVITGGGIFGSEGNVNLSGNAPAMFLFSEDDLRAGNQNRGAIALSGAGTIGMAAIQGELVEANSAGPCLAVTPGQSSNTTNVGGGDLMILGGEFDNCTGDAIQLGGVSVSNSGTATVGAGSTGFGWRLREGARVHLNAGGDTLTGASGNVSLDGVNAITYAQVTANAMLARADLGSSVSTNTADVTSGVTLLSLLATGALPAASVANKGALTFDTTALVPKYSDGVAWNAVPGPSNGNCGVGLSAPAFPAGGDVGTCRLVKAATQDSLEFVSQTPGTGAGTFTLSLCGAPGACASSFGNIVIACASAAGTRTVGTVSITAIPAATNVNWRITANACTANASALGQATMNYTTP